MKRVDEITLAKERGAVLLECGYHANYARREQMRRFKITHTGFGGYWTDFGDIENPVAKIVDVAELMAASAEPENMRKIKLEMLPQKAIAVVNNAYLRGCNAGTDYPEVAWVTLYDVETSEKYGQHVTVALNVIEKQSGWVDVSYGGSLPVPQRYDGRQLRRADGSYSVKCSDEVLCAVGINPLQQKRSAK